MASFSKLVGRRQFALEAAEEVFSNSVVVRVAFARRMQPLAISRGSALNTPLWGAGVSRPSAVRFGSIHAGKA